MSDRRQFLAACAAAAIPAASRADNAPWKVPAFELSELGIADLQAGLTAGKFTARSLTDAYLARVAAVDAAGPRLRSVIEVNPDAVALADKLDAERKAGKVRGPLHGVPVLLKDNIDTADRMQTTAGSLALVGVKRPADAPLAARLRAAGAVILGKTNLSEWANFRSTKSSSGWSGRGGQTRCPYALDRNPSGSSSGSAVAPAANLCAAAVGTETDGSIVSPASQNGVVGVKPTVGLVSRTGVIPISRTQDTAGPMARTVRDAAVLLGVLAGTDPADPATADADRKRSRDYTVFLDPAGLKGARLGVVRRYWGTHAPTDKVMDEALSALKAAGAVLVDPVGGPEFGRFGANEITVLLYEFKAGLNDYLEKLGPAAPVKSLADVIVFNEKHQAKEMPHFGHELFLRAEECGPLTDREYLDALGACRRLSRAEGIDKVMDEHKLDALVAPTTGPAAVLDLVYGARGNGPGGCSAAAAVAGYPHVTVPAGWLYGLPVGLSFFGRAWSEGPLLKYAYAFEQATRHRKPPRFLATPETKG